MSRRARRNHTPAFKAKVALAAVKGDRTLAQRAVRRPSQLDHIVEGAARGLRRCGVRSRERQRDSPAGSRREVAAREDQGTDAGERFFRRSAQKAGLLCAKR